MEISTFSPTLSFPICHKPTPLSSSSSTLFVGPTFAATRLTRTLTRTLVVNPTPRRRRRRRGLVCNSLFGLGVPELAVIAGVAALVFGPKQLPEIGRTLGKSIKGFQQAAKEFEQELKNPDGGESSDNLEAKPASQSLEEKENFVKSSKDTS